MIIMMVIDNTKKHNRKKSKSSRDNNANSIDEGALKDVKKNDTKNVKRLHDFDLFVFDWDGTLTELKIIRTLDQKYGPYWFYKRMRYGKYRKNSININTINKKSREFREYIISVFADFYLTLLKPKLHNDVKLLLTLLKSRRKKVALFTNGTEWRINKEFEIFKIKDLFDMVLSAQKIKVIKPDPTGLNIIIRKLRIRKDKVLYIGDMVDDIIMAKSAGVASCALGNGFDKEGTLKSANPDFYFKSIEEFLSTFSSEEK